MASYLIVSAAFDDFVPEVNTTVPRKLTHFIEEVNDGTVSDASLKLAKDWLDTTGRCPHYINPVHAVLVSKEAQLVSKHERNLPLAYEVDGESKGPQSPQRLL